jgi:hypothetical protein
VNTDEKGSPVLDLFADHRLTEPVFGHISSDGSVELLDSFRSHFSFDPAIEGDEEAARARVQAHNNRVSEELRRGHLL